MYSRAHKFAVHSASPKWSVLGIQSFTKSKHIYGGKPKRGENVGDGVCVLISMFVRDFHTIMDEDTATQSVVNFVRFICYLIKPSPYSVGYRDINLSVVS